MDDMQFVPGATFRMGTDAAELDSIAERVGLDSSFPLLPEVPSHEVRVGDFYMDSNLVTNRDFSLFVEANPEWGKRAADPALHNGRYLEHWTDASPEEALLDNPVIFISWQAAAAFCAWRGKRLPTEAEFEWAAQDGITEAEFPWGDDLPNDSLVNWGGDGIETTVPVGSYPPNARGLYDMAGNVWQFTADPWLGSHGETLSAANDVEETALDPSIRRVVRGGSWGASAANLRVRYRDSHRPFDAREMVGFRCARSR